MLIVAKSLKDFSFSKLMEIYAEGNLENARELWPDEPAGRQLALAEEEFYLYLYQVFFRTEGACYLIWQVDGRYVSALRLEPYRDGLLLEALETAPEYRRQGFAAELVRAAQGYAAGTKIYSHVNKGNLASLRTHEKCGFERILESAVYIDGSADNKSCTFCYTP
jgi:GNAT superfamily N-acetyltransferase